MMPAAWGAGPVVRHRESQPDRLSGPEHHKRNLVDGEWAQLVAGGVTADDLESAGHLRPTANQLVISRVIVAIGGSFGYPQATRT